jgi:hypothetical protein
MTWVSKITTVALEMILPGLAGLWLDSQLETRFLTLLGLHREFFLACGT